MAAAVGGVAATWIGKGQRDVAASAAAVTLPVAQSPAAAIPAGAELAVKGITPYLTSRSKFYRIDTALVLPRLTTSAWKLRIHGMVANEIHLTYNQLLALPLIERLVTLSCVSNEVGGNLISNARWLGYPLKDLLSRADPSKHLN